MQKGHLDICRICSLEKINKNGIIVFTLGKRIHWKFFYEVIFKTNTYTLKDLFCKSSFFFEFVTADFIYSFMGSQSWMQESCILRVIQGWRGRSLSSSWLLLWPSCEVSRASYSEAWISESDKFWRELQLFHVVAGSLTKLTCSPQFPLLQDWAIIEPCVTFRMTVWNVRKHWT